MINLLNLFSKKQQEEIKKIEEMLDAQCSPIRFEEARLIEEKETPDNEAISDGLFYCFKNHIDIDTPSRFRLLKSELKVYEIPCPICKNPMTNHFYNSREMVSNATLRLEKQENAYALSS